MPPDKVRPPAGNRRAEEKAPGDGLSDVIVAESTDNESACEAFVVLVITPAGRYWRRVFLSLHSATAAVRRARAKGQPVRMVLCRLVPVAAALDLTGEWSP
jgi:hypothetical protein